MTMNYRLSEALVLLLNIAKWVILASVAGLLVGVSTTIFLKSLGLVLSLSNAYSYSLYFLPFGLMASAWITSTFAPEAGGQGLERVIQAIHYRSGKIQGQVIPAKLLATILTIGVGGSAGSVGPCAQIGGGLASVFSTLCRLDDADRKTIVICGISAGFASVLGTPMAAAFFGVEALFVGSLAYQVLLPSVIAATVSHQVTLGFGIEYWSVSLEAVPALSIAMSPWLIGAGLLFGLCAILFIETVNLGMYVSLHMNLHPAIKGFLGGSAILLVAMLLSQQVLGLGVDVIRDTVQGHQIAWYIFFLKILVTSITLNFGGSGGIILPICFVGTTTGALYGSLFGLPTDLFAALGLAGLLAGAINTPITAVLLTIELFGLPVGPYAIVICAISFLISGHRSAIPTQLLELSKAPAIRAALKQEISQAKAEIDPWNIQLRPYKEILKRYGITIGKSQPPDQTNDNHPK